MKSESGSHHWFFPFLPIHLSISLSSDNCTSECIHPHHLRLGHHRPPTCAHCESFQLCLSLIHSTFTCAGGVWKVKHASFLLKTIWWHCTAIKKASNGFLWPARLYMICSCPLSEETRPLKLQDTSVFLFLELDKRPRQPCSWGLSGSLSRHLSVRLMAAV